MFKRTRNTIWVVFLFWAMHLSAQITIIDEDFSSVSLPSGWSNINNGGTSLQIWEFNDPGGRNISSGNFSGNFAILDSDNYGNGNNQNASLETPTFSTGAYETIFLEFDYQYRDFNGGESCVIEVFNGTTWTEVFRKEFGDDNYSGADFESINITTEVGAAPNAQIKFTYTGAWDYWWAIDNVKVTGTPFSTSNAYLGPGGVGNTNGNSNLKAWYYPNNIRNSGNSLPTDGEAISTWLDASGYGNTATNTGIATFESDGSSQVNGNSIMKGTSLNRQFTTTNTLTARTLIAVNNPGTLGSLGGVVGFNGDKGIRRDRNNDDLWQFSGGGGGVNIDTWSSTNGESYVNGSTSASGTHNKQLHIISQERPTSFTNTFYIGGYYPGRSFTGDVAEVIVFDIALNLAEKIIVDNYLSAKYNIPLTNNDFYNEDDNGNGNFDYNVAGIGRASDGSGHIDSQGTGIIRINTPSALNNNDFLFWGEDVKDANYNFSSSDATNYLERLDTKWRVSKQNNLGTVTVSLKASDINFNSPDGCNDLKLIVSSSATFATKTTYDFVLSGGVYTATEVSFNDNDYFTLEYKDLIVLDDSQFYNGAGASNNPNTTDACHKLLVTSNADGLLTLTEDAHVREVEIESGGILAVNTGKYIKIKNGIELNGDIRLLGTSQLIQTHSGGSQISGTTGSLYVNQIATTTNAYQSGYWSSPVRKSGATLGTLYSINDVLKDGTNVSLLATPTAGEAAAINFTSSLDGNSTTDPIEISSRWLASFLNDTDWKRYINPTSAEFTPGMGWNMKSVGATFTFKGIPNDGEFSFSIDQNKYSLLGNPYPSALDSQKFISDNSSEFTGTLYVYDGSSDNSHTRGAYTGTYGTIVSGVSVGSGRYLPIGQAFFVVRSTAGTGILTFNNSQRTLTTLTDTENLIAKTKNKKPTNTFLKVGFKFNISDTEVRSRQIAIAFRGLSENYEEGFDAEMLSLQPTDVYLTVNDKERPFIITGIQHFDSSLSIPLVVTVDEQKEVTFSIDEQQNIESPIYLFDGHTNNYYNLNESDQTLKLAEGLFKNRFFITFTNQTLSVEENEYNNLISIFQENEELVLKNNSNELISSLTIFNLTGQRIVSIKDKNKLEEREIRLKTNKIISSIYILQLITEKGVFSKKILIE